MSALEDLCRELVAFDTVSQRSDLEPMARLAERLEDRGFRVRLQRYGGEDARKANLVACAGPPVPGGLALSGHLDVVPFADQPGWTRDPLRLSEADGRLYGRGTSDMKGFLAQCVEAVGDLDLGRLARPLVLLFTSDEEVGCRGAERLVPELPELLGGYPLPRVCWIGEPTSWKVFRTHKGIVELAVRVRGRGGHSSLPEEGVNAIAVAARAVAAIGAVQEELRAERDARWAALFPEAPYTTLNFGTIRGGTASNMIAEECRLHVSYRPLPDHDPLDAYHRIRTRLAELPRGDFGGDAHGAELELLPPSVIPGMDSPEGGPLEAALFEVVGAVRSGGAPFCTDGGRFAPAGMDSWICGPGDLDQAHQPDESISREALAVGPERIRRVIHRLCG